MKNVYNSIKVILCAVLLSVFFVPTIFLANIISWKTDILEFVFLALMAGLFGTALISESKKVFFLKWILSIPLSYLCLQYFWQTDYAVRSFNWIFSYTQQSVGGKFAGGFLIVVFCILCFISWIIALNIKLKPSQWKWFEKIQLCLCSILGVAIVVVVILLEQQFPAYSQLFG